MECLTTIAATANHNGGIDLLIVTLATWLSRVPHKMN